MASTPTSFDDVIRFAVEREEDAARGYGEMMAMVKDEGLKRLLRDLLNDELKHKDVLLGISEDAFAGGDRNDVMDLKITDYLVGAPPDTNMNFQDLLIFAAKKEKKAVDLYSELSRRAGSSKRRKLFEYLAKQELSHKLRLEAEYEKRVLRED